MPSNIPQLTGLFREAMEMSELSADESVLVVSQSESRTSYVQSFMNASESIGAHAESLQLPGFDQPLFPYGGATGNALNTDEYIQSSETTKAAFAAADIIIDLTAAGLIHTKARDFALENDARMLTVWEPPAIIERLFPTEQIRERAEESKRLMQEASEMRVTTEAGTNVTVEFESTSPVLDQYGYTDEPGSWDHLGSALMAAYPVDSSPNGRIVMDVGDVLLPMNRYVDRPIEFHIEDGYITDINGEGADAELVRGYLDHWGTDDAYATSHFGWGLHENAVWESLSFYNQRGLNIRGVEQRSALGGFLWSTGPNRFAGRYTRAHLDLAMRDCTFELDGETIIEHGDVVDDRLLPP